MMPTDLQGDLRKAFQNKDKEEIVRLNKEWNSYLEYQSEVQALREEFDEKLEPVMSKFPL
jgi:hypothetical protein